MKKKLFLSIIFFIFLFNLISYKSFAEDIDYATSTEENAVNLNESRHNVNIFSDKVYFIPGKDSYIDKKKDFLGVSIKDINGEGYIKINDLKKIFPVNSTFVNHNRLVGGLFDTIHYRFNSNDYTDIGKIINVSTFLPILKYKWIEYPGGMDYVKGERLGLKLHEVVYEFVDITYMVNKYSDEKFNFYFKNMAKSDGGVERYDYWFCRKNDKNQVIYRKFNVYGRNDSIYVKIDDFKKVIYPYLLEIFRQ